LLPNFGEKRRFRLFATPMEFAGYADCIGWGDMEMARHREGTAPTLAATLLLAGLGLAPLVNSSPRIDSVLRVGSIPITQPAPDDDHPIGGRFTASREQVWADIPLVGPVVHLPCPSGDDVELILVISAFAEPLQQTVIDLEVVADLTAAAEPIVDWQPITVVPPRQLPQRLESSFIPVSATAVTTHHQQRTGSINPTASTIRLVSLPAELRRTAGATPQPSLECHPVWVGSGITVWCPDDEAVTDDLMTWIAEVGSLMERESLPLVRNDQGAWPDVDGDNQVNLLVTERVSRLDSDVKAFVRRSDFSQAVPSTTPWDVIYLKPFVSLEELRPILVHELTHVVEFSWCRERCPQGEWPIHDWLTEGLAHAAELRLTGAGDNTHPRLRAFLRQPSAAPLVVHDAVATGLWRHPGQRGATAAFCDWLTRTYPQVRWSTIIPTEEVDDDLWTTLCGREFPDLYRDWTISLASGAAGLAEESQSALPWRSLEEQSFHRVILTGTASDYIRLPSSTSSSRKRLAVTLPPEHNCQLTIVARPLVME
jgi:hypothetical protein